MYKNKLKNLFILLLILPVLILAAKTAVDLRKGAAGIPARLFIDASSNAGPINRQLWQNLAQGGEEPRDMIGPVFTLVRQLQPQLIRVDHLFDYYNVYQGNNNYDFSRLDQVINSILLTGAKPLLSLSYTPAIMAQNNLNAAEPNNWNDWYQMVKATAARYSKEKNIEGIYYEVWNEPDLFGKWHYAKNPNYLTLYNQSARAVEEGARGTSYKIGGPAITAFYPSWIKSLLKYADTNRLRLDFISWHRYSKNIADFQKDIDSLNQILTDSPKYQNIEKIITEAGPNPEPDPWYDDSRGAIHFLSLVSQTTNTIHRLFPFEIVDGPTSRSPNSSGWGLITHPLNQAKTKPRFQAIRFLNSLGGQKLSIEGQGSYVSAIATRTNQTIQVLLVNYDPRQTRPETFPLTIHNLSPGNYTLKTQRFLGTFSQKNITVTENFYRDNFFLDVNTAVLLELTPQP